MATTITTGPGPLTLGESRVRTNFNVTASTSIDHIKQKAAELIDLIKGERLATGETHPEKQRLIDLAATEIEAGAMWAVKAITF